MDDRSIALEFIRQATSGSKSWDYLLDTKLERLGYSIREILNNQDKFESKFRLIYSAWGNLDELDSVQLYNAMFSICSFIIALDKVLEKVKHLPPDTEFTLFPAKIKYILKSPAGSSITVGTWKDNKNIYVGPYILAFSKSHDINIIGPTAESTSKIGFLNLMLGLDYNKVIDFNRQIQSLKEVPIFYAFNCIMLNKNNKVVWDSRRTETTLDKLGNIKELSILQQF